MKVRQPAELGSVLLAGALALATAAAAQVPADAANGRKLAAQACQTCHGVDGVGRMPNVPNIGGESVIYLVKQLKAFRDGERKDEVMSVVAEPLTDEQIADVAAWYATIKFNVTVPP